MSRDSSNAFRVALLDLPKPASEAPAEAPDVTGRRGSGRNRGDSRTGEVVPGTFLLADLHVDCDWPTDEMRIYTGANGLLLAVPMADGLWRIAAPVANNHREGPPADPILEQIQKIWDERAAAGVRFHDPVWMNLFHVSSRLVERLRVGRVFVAGDAAHIHSPVGGQGMNTGMQGTFNLGWKLALALRGRGGEALLDSYHGERHPNAMTLLRATERATRAMIGQGFVASVVRAAAMTVLGNFDFVRDKVALGLSELPVGYRGSPLCVESGPGGMSPTPATVRRTPKGFHSSPVRRAGCSSGGGRTCCISSSSLPVPIPRVSGSASCFNSSARLTPNTPTCSTPCWSDPAPGRPVTSPCSSTPSARLTIATERARNAWSWFAPMVTSASASGPPTVRHYGATSGRFTALYRRRRSLGTIVVGSVQES
jgi:hypothetical protein